MNLELVIKSHCYTPIFINNTSLQLQYGFLQQNIKT